MHINSVRTNFEDTVLLKHSALSTSFSSVQKYHPNFMKKKTLSITPTEGNIFFSVCECGRGA